MTTTIGFANKYYTMWEVSEPIRIQLSKYTYRTEQVFSYIQNLSFDLDKAKAKVSGKFEVDLSLRGSSTFTKTSDVTSDAPENIFKFGKYADQDIREVNDVKYTLWYYEQTQNEFAKKLLLDNGYVENDGKVISAEYSEILKETQSRKDSINSLDDGHHFDDGKRVSLELKQVDFFSFDGPYGTTYIITYASKCGKKFKYMGSAIPDVSNIEFHNVKATIYHSDYKGEKQTRLKRINVIKVSK